MDFVAFDFETANERRCSPCALGIVVVRQGEPVERYSCLIRPREFRFTPFLMSINGIRPADVMEQPEFGDLWPTIRKYFESRFLLAHNVSFDISVLRNTLDLYGIEYPEASYSCTRDIAKAVWPGQPTYNLKAVAKLLGLTFRHHDALEDAEACANVALCAARTAGARSTEELCALAEARRHSSDRGRATRGPRPIRTDCRLVQSAGETPSGGVLSGQCFVFTGQMVSMKREDAMAIVDRLGGESTDSVSKKVSFLVVGGLYSDTFAEGYKTGKLKKAAAMIAEGASLEVISEDDFLKMIDP